MPQTAAELLRIDARAAADHRGVLAAPASLLVRVGGPDPMVVEVGPPEQVDRHPLARAARRVGRKDAILIPGLVNAHTHLDLTHIGPLRHDPGEGFKHWVDRVRARRLHDASGIGASVGRGIELGLAGGTVAVGDIAGAVRAGPEVGLAAAMALRGSPMRGVSFLEFFAFGHARENGIGRMAGVLAAAREEWGDRRGQPVDNLTTSEGRRHGIGLQPHAPNTVDRAGYTWAIHAAAEHGWPLATHLAESPEERRFIGAGDGPHKELLASVGAWDDALLGTEVGLGLHPVEHLWGVLELAAERAAGQGRPSILAAHANDVTDEAIALLSRARVAVVYCPRAAEYFGAGAHFGPHRYREMLAAGVLVALGTDSIVNLPAAAATEGVSVLDEMRLLVRRDGIDAALALRMGTVNGAAALGLDGADFEFAAGHAVAGVVAVPLPRPDRTLDALRALMHSDGRPELLLIGNHSCETGNRTPGGGRGE